MSSPNKDNKKKPYSKPELTQYGDIRDLTNAVGSTTKNSDGGTGKTNKTH